MLRFVQFVVVLAPFRICSAGCPPHGVIKECLRDWARPILVGNTTTCPYGERLPGQITYSNDFHKGAPFWHAVCIVLSYVPYVVCACAVIEFFVKRGTRELNFVCFMTTIVVLNEFVWKRLVKEVRPLGSCNVTCGMPSSHATISIGFLSLMFFDLALRVNPMSPSVLQNHGTTHGQRQLSHTVKGTAKYFIYGDWLSLIPVSNAESISNMQFIRMCLFWFDILAFVPLSRVMLKDHTVSQVTIGGVIGLVEAFVWYFFVRELAWRYQHKLGATWPEGSKYTLLTHNYSVPRHEELQVRIGGNLERARQILDQELVHGWRGLSSGNPTGLVARASECNTDNATTEMAVVPSAHEVV